MNAIRHVYVIMPVGSDPLFFEKKVAIDQGIRKTGRVAKFPIYHPERPTFELSEVLREISEADLVLADLSGERPSCYYELGLAEAIGTPVLLIARVGTPIHQCAGRQAVRFYRDIADLIRTVECSLMINIQTA